MKSFVQGLVEVAICFLMLFVVYVLAVGMKAQGDIPLEPPEQLDEAVIDGWGDPRSSEWSRVRNSHVKLHPYCEACGSTESLNVHHIAPFHLHPEKELDPLNLLTLCREHHFRVGHDPDGPWEPKRPSWKAFNPRVREHCEKIRESSR